MLVRHSLTHSLTHSLNDMKGLENNKDMLENTQAIRF